MTIAVETRPGAVTLAVTDDGCGFDPVRVSPGSAGGLGIPGMRERAESLGGALRVAGAEGAGTRVEVTLPLRGVADRAMEGAG